MTQATREKAAGIGAAAIFAAAALSALGRLVLDRPWPHLATAHSHAISALLAVLWGGAAAACLLRRRSLALVAIVGTFAFLPHFVITRAIDAPVWFSVSLLAAIPVLVVLELVAFGKRPELGQPSTSATMPPPSHVGKEIL